MIFSVMCELIFLYFSLLMVFFFFSLRDRLIRGIGMGTICITIMKNGVKLMLVNHFSTGETILPVIILKEITIISYSHGNF